MRGWRISNARPVAHTPQRQGGDDDDFFAASNYHEMPLCYQVATTTSRRPDDDVVICLLSYNALNARVSRINYHGIPFLAALPSGF